MTHRTCKDVHTNSYRHKITRQTWKIENTDINFLWSEFNFLFQHLLSICQHLYKYSRRPGYIRRFSDGVYTFDMYTKVGVSITFISLNVQLGYNIINTNLNYSSVHFTILKNSIGMGVVWFTYCVSHNSQKNNSFDICILVTKLEKDERFISSLGVSPDYAVQ